MVTAGTFPSTDLKRIMNQNFLSGSFLAMEKTNLDYRSFILREFEKRKAKNPKYSLRAFAKHLGTATSRLSEILNGKAGLSPEKAYGYVDKLGLNGFERDLFLTLIESRHARSEMARRIAQQKIDESTKNYSQLNMDDFHLIADWYHFAVLEYFQLSYADQSPQTIAHFFKIDVEKVHLALERLQRLGLIEKNNEVWKTVDRIRETTTDVSSEAVRQVHKELLEKGIEALEKQTVENRDFKAYIFSFHKQDLPFVKKKLNAFQEQLAIEMDLSPQKDSVYCLSFNLFELSDSERTKHHDV